MCCVCDEPVYHLEQNLQSLESNQVFNCLTASKKENPFPPFPCPFCERAYTSWGFRRRHIKAVHTHSQRLTCKWCLLVLETHADWKNHVSSAHGLSPSDANNGILILDEANMVLRIPNSPRLDTLVTMIKGSLSGKPGSIVKEHTGVSMDTDTYSQHEEDAEDLTSPKEKCALLEEKADQTTSRDRNEEEYCVKVKEERPDTPE